MYLNLNIEPSSSIVAMDRFMIHIKTNLVEILIYFLACFMIFLYVYVHQKIRRMLYLTLHKKIGLLKRFQLSFYTRFFTFMQLMLLEKRPIFEVFVDITNRFKNTVFEKDLKTILIEIQSGRSFSSIFEGSPIFDHVIAQLFHQAQSNEQIYEIASVLSQYYYEALMMRDQQFYAFIEPVLIALLSVCVGLIAFMIYEPLFSMYEGL
jgi:type II secretory pathway component PulF